MVHPGSFRPCDCWDWIHGWEDEDVRSQQKPCIPGNIWWHPWNLSYFDVHSHSWGDGTLGPQWGCWAIFRRSWPWSTSMICTFCTATWNRETSSCQRVAGCSAISAHLSTLETSNHCRAIPEPFQSHSRAPEPFNNGDQERSGPRSRMKLSCLRFQWSFLFAKEISRWVTSALPRPDFLETPKDGTLSWIPTAFFFLQLDQARFISFSEKNIFSPLIEHHEHHFPVVLLNILIILMIFQLFRWDFPYTYGRGCQALSPFRQVLECTAACAQTQIGTPWTEMILDPLGCDVCWFSELFPDIPVKIHVLNLKCDF